LVKSLLQLKVSSGGRKSCVRGSGKTQKRPSTHSTGKLERKKGEERRGDSFLVGAPQRRPAGKGKNRLERGTKRPEMSQSNLKANASRKGKGGSCSDSALKGTVSEVQEKGREQRGGRRWKGVRGGALDGTGKTPVGREKEGRGEKLIRFQVGSREAERGEKAGG